MRRTLLLITMLITCIFTAPAQAPDVPSNFNESDAGKSSNPYKIATLDNLYWLSQNGGYWASGYYFIQTADIDADSTKYWDGGSGFSPIGNSTTNFTGTYNGNGYKITNLSISRSSTDYIGFFGCIGSNGVVDSLGVGIDSITGKDNVGGLAGYNGGTVRSCSTSGVVSGTTSVGGCIGYNSGGTVSYSHSSVTTNGSYDVGAFIGDNVSNGTISYCYATGNSNGGATNPYYTSGGLVGWNEHSSISNCYATGNVIGNAPVGGLVGGNGGGGTVSYSYAVGTVTGITSSTGGLAGSNSGTITSCFYNTDTFTGSTSYGTGKDSTALKTQITFTNAGWDFVGETTNGTTDVWTISTADNDGYPCFIQQVTIPLVSTKAISDIDRTSATGTGQIVSLAASSFTGYGLCWSNTHTMPTISDNKIDLGATSRTGTFTVSLTGLTVNTTYYVRAYGVNSSGTYYGDTLSFTTTEFISIVPSGSGTSSEPYQMATLHNLYWLSQHPGYWSSSFIQTTDIDADSTKYWSSGSGFSPIGNSTTNFTGTYNGNGHKITNLYINRSSTTYIGFFGCIGSGGYVDSIGVGIDSIFGNESVGGLAGYSRGTINSCYTTGIVNGTTNVGSFIGYNVNGKVSYSYSTATVNGSNNVSAFIGSNESGSSISYCYSTGNVNGGGSGNYTAGGLVGWNDNSTISNSYTTGTIKGASPIGGLVGGGSGTITNCYAIDTINCNAGSTNIGGLIGNGGSATITGSFYNTDVFTGTTSYGTGKSTTELKTQSTFVAASWDKTIWFMDDGYNNSYAYLAWQNPNGTPIFLLGSGTSADPYQISTLKHLYWLSQTTDYNSCYFVQTANINADTTRYWNSGSGFSPIGSFSGHYNGKGHTISGLYINSPSSSTNHTGLFSQINGGTVDSLGLLADTVYGYQYVGGLAGACISGATITNCYATGKVWGVINIVGGLAGALNTNCTMSNCYTLGTVSGNSTMEGGLVGSLNNSSTVKNCYSSCTVSGLQITGGLVGDHSNSSTISNCYATGNVSSDTLGVAGGLVGYATSSAVVQNSYATGTVSSKGYAVGGLIGYTLYKINVSNCYARGSVTGVGNIGGLIGIHDSSTVTCCYSTGAVTGTTNVGGLIGYNKEHSTVDSCFWDLQTSGIDTGCGKNKTGSTFTATGNNTSAMQTQSTFTSAGWNVNMWCMDASINDGYPYLAWQNSNGTALPVELASLSESIPHVFALNQNYPNPFNPSTTISFTLAQNGFTTLKIYDMLGREVAMLVNGNLKAGVINTVTFNASKLSSGVYFSRLVSGSSAQVKKLVLMK
jgi:hypothetical protein